MTPETQRAVAEAVEQWMNERKPSCEESFYQMDSVNEALPELGIAIFKAMKTDTISKAAKDSQSTV